MNNIYLSLPKPFLVLAPMENVTDVVFREIMATNLPRPDLFFTEFTNVHGLNSRGRQATLEKLEFTENQRPIIAQIWGTNPEFYLESAKLIQDLGFDGIDINMGCPDRKVMKGGAGAAMCNTPELAIEVIKSVKQGAPNLPISVKTRLGVKNRVTENWTTILLEQQLAALTIHARTAKEMSDVPADWSEIGKVVAIRDEISPDTAIIGNGDVMSYQQAKELAEEHKVDGVMIARGVFADPWVFDKTIPAPEHTQKERFEVMKQHVVAYHQRYGDKKFDILKKFFKMYLKDFPEAAKIRAEFMECRNTQEFMECYDRLAT